MRESLVEQRDKKAGSILCRAGGGYTQTYNSERSTTTRVCKSVSRDLRALGVGRMYSTANACQARSMPSFTLPPSRERCEVRRPTAGLPCVTWRFPCPFPHLSILVNSNPSSLRQCRSVLLLAISLAFENMSNTLGGHIRNVQLP